jgi:hypothetical protein
MRPTEASALGGMMERAWQTPGHWLHLTHASAALERVEIRRMSPSVYAGYAAGAAAWI